MVFNDVYEWKLYDDDWMIVILISIFLYIKCFKGFIECFKK